MVLDSKRDRVEFILEPIARSLTRFSPNTISWFAFALAILAGIAIVASPRVWPVLLPASALLVILSGLFDALDGKVARLTGVADFVGEKAADYDVQVGPNGSNFSGGQQQLIAIARAMLRDSDFLLLDEATSNLDIKSEVQVNRALDELMKGRTTVIIAHNFAATRAAKNVIVLHEGRVEAVGTPAELLQSNDYYNHFVRSEAEESLPGCDLPAGQAVPRG
jgi:ABC-type uncharacterized transport system ATPase subunit